MSDLARQELREGAIEEVETQVQTQLGSRIRDFRLQPGAEGLILCGHAHTYHAKQLAQHAVMAATELPIEANEIDVR